MRYVRAAIFISAIMVATGVFLPCIQLGIGGVAFGKSSTLSLYGAVNKTLFMESFVARSDASTSKHISDGLLAVALEYAPRSARRQLRSAKSTLSDIETAQKEAQIGTIGNILRIAGLTFLALLAIAAVLLLKSISSGRDTRRRLIWVTSIMAIISLVSIAIFYAIGEAVSIANEEAKLSLFSRGAGSYLMVVGGVVGLLGALALWVNYLKLRQGKPAAASDFGKTVSDVRLPAEMAQLAAQQVASPPAVVTQEQNRSSLSSE